MAFNGTSSLDFTQSYSECKINIPDKASVDIKVYEDIMANWIKCYAKNNQGRFPQIILIYRDGLSD